MEREQGKREREEERQIILRGKVERGDEEEGKEREMRGCYKGNVKER